MQSVQESAATRETRQEMRRTFIVNKINKIEKISDKNTTLLLSLMVVKNLFTTMCKAGFFEAAHYRTHRHQNR